MIKFLKLFDKILFNTLKTITLICFIILTVIISANVIIRFAGKIPGFPPISFHWFDEIVELFFAVMVFIGAAALWMTGEHFKLEYFRDKIKEPKLNVLFSILIEILSLVFIVFYTVFSFKLMYNARDWSNIFRISKKFFYGSIPLSGLIMFIYSIKNIVLLMIKFRKLSKPDDSDAENPVIEA